MKRSFEFSAFILNKVYSYFSQSKAFRNLISQSDRSLILANQEVGAYLSMIQQHVRKYGHVIAGTGVLAGVGIAVVSNRYKVSKDMDGNEHGIADHVVLRSNKQIQLNQSIFRNFREMMSDITIKVVKANPSNEKAIQMLTEAVNDAENAQMLEQTGALAMLLNLAAGDECSACTDEFLDALGRLAENDHYAATIAEDATRYGKQALLNLAFTHERNPKLGHALNKLVLVNSDACHFGPANLVSLISLVASSGLPDCFYEFAWWALGRSCGSGPVPPRYRLKKLIFGDDRVKKTRKSLLSNGTLWGALHRVKKASLSVQQQAAKFVAVVTTDPTTGVGVWKPERLDLLIHWLYSNSVPLQKSALIALGNLSKEPDIRQHFKAIGVFDQLLELFQKGLDNRLIKPAIKTLSAMSQPVDGQDFALDQHALSVDNTTSYSIESEYSKGWIELNATLLENEDPQIQALGRECFQSLLKHSQYSSNVALEWMGTLIDVSVKHVPSLATALRVEEIRSRSRATRHTTEVLEATHLEMLRTAAYLCDSREIHQDFVTLGGLDVLNYHSSTSNILLQQQIARTLANLLATDTPEPDVVNLIQSPYWSTVLSRWKESKDMKLRSYATRVIENFNSKHGVFFSDGLNPLHQSSRASTDHLAESYQDNRFGSMNYDINDTREVDIIMIHGLMGGAFETWKGGEHDAETSVVSVDTMWPTAWLAHDLEGRKFEPRVMSISYEANILESSAPWPALSLQERSEVMLTKLSKAAVGRRPTVFITHSLGGILLKEMIHLALESDDPAIREIAQNTRGIIFYAVPHHGTPLATLNISRMTKTLFRPHPALKDIHGSAHLKLLNDRLGALDHVSVLSFGEENPVAVPIIGAEAIVVPVESSNPGFGTFHVIENSTHIDLCKPASKQEPPYVITLDFITQVLSAAAT